MYHADSNYYTVKDSDTFYSIAKFFNVSLDELAEANPNITPDSLMPGQMLCIPLTAPSANCPSGSTCYTVQKGDTFYSISKSLKVSLNALVKANPGINPDALLPGQSICIPILWNIYESSTYRIRFLYPYRWSRIEKDRYEGVDGFFHVFALYSADSLLDICRKEAYHKLKPYGTSPIIKSKKIKGLEAYLIMPSTDQPMEMHGQSALVVKLADTEETYGSDHNFLIIRADKGHIKGILGSLEFIT